MAEHPRGAVLRRAIEVFISPDDNAIERLGELFTDDVTVWTPNMLAFGVVDLAGRPSIRESAFSNVNIQEFDALDIFGSRGFTGPRRGDLLRPLRHRGDGGDRTQRKTAPRAATAAVVDFAGDKIKAVRAYFDDASLLEQMLNT